MNKLTLELCEFFSICTQIIHHAGKIIKETTETSSLNTKFKGIEKDDPYTEADVKVQTLTIKTLRHNWPTIKIIGEEEEAFEKDLGIDFTQFKKDLIPKDLFKNFQSTEVNLDNCIVWVDPLDGTKDFVAGTLDSVTTLIGISFDNESKIGMTGKYFTKTADEKYEWTPKCFFSHADFPHIYYVDFLKNLQISELVPEKQPDNRFWVGTTNHHWDDSVKEGMNKINPEKLVKIGGSGNKILSLVDGRIDCYFYPKEGCKMWDICAGEALLKSAGGILTDTFGKKYTYPENKDQWVCSKGVVATLDKEIHKKVINSFNQTN